jgi:hypothetical protein
MHIYKEMKNTCSYETTEGEVVADTQKELAYVVQFADTDLMFPYVKLFCYEKRVAGMDIIGVQRHIIHLLESAERICKKDIGSGKKRAELAAIMAIDRNNFVI